MSGRSDEAVLLDRLYATASDRRQWQEALEPLAKVVGGSSAWLSQQDLVEGGGGGYVWGMDPAVQDAYFTSFSGMDVLSLRGDEISPAGPVLTDEHRIPRDALLKSVFYNEFMQLAKANAVLIVDLGIDAGKRSAIHINRPNGYSRFGDAEIARAARLLPHLRRAMHISNRLGDAADRHADLAAALDAAAPALLLLDRQGRLVHANAAGMSLLMAGISLRLSAGRVRAAAPAADNLALAIAQAAALDPALRRASSVAVAGARVAVAPLGRHPAALGRAAVMLSLDATGKPTVTATRLRDLFKLTPAEAGVALLLLQGLTPRLAAEQLGTQLQTVRNQMRRIFEKTGMSRQSDLIRLLMSL